LLCAHLDPCAVPGFHGFSSIADQIEQRAIKLLVIGFASRVGSTRLSNSIAASPSTGCRLATSSTSGASANARASAGARRHGRNAACASPESPRDQARRRCGREPLHHGSSMRARRSKPAGRWRECFAEIVLDFGDRAAKRGEPRLLLQKPAISALHRGKLALGLPISSLRSGCLDDAAGIFGSSRNRTMARVRRPIGRTSTA